MTTQSLIHYSAQCFDCDKRCDARNAQAWAHNHARMHGHRVELSLAWQVRPDAVETEKAA